jgi:hypothetical protein
MTNVEHQEISEVVARVAAWPPAERIKLARKILETVETAGEKRSSRGYSAAEVIALLQIRQPAPDDQTVRRWIDEHRTEKYGS